MSAKFFQKATQSPQHNVPHGSVRSTDLEPRVGVHYGIPSTASILAFDPIQHLLAIGTLDGRIKVIGGDNIEGLLISPKPLPFKNLEFLQNQGFLASVSNENEIQIWDLEHRRIASTLQWESNITAFSTIYGTQYMYVGDEYGFLSVLKYDAKEGSILLLPFHIPANLVTESAGISISGHQSIVGVLPQPCSLGNRVLIAYENGLIILWDVTEDQAVLVRGNKDLELEDEMVFDSPNEVNNKYSSDASDHEQADKDISSLCWLSSDGSILAVGYVDGDILLWNLSNAASTKAQQPRKSSNNVVKLQLSSGDRRIPVIVLRWSANAHNGHGGRLFVYGGDEIGSEEVLTILNLDWSSGIETLKFIGRVDLTLNGSFADITLAPNAGAADSSYATSLFVLTNPGQLHLYDDACLSALMSQPDKKQSVPGFQYPALIPTVEPCMTVGKLILAHSEESLSSAFLEAVSAAKLRVAHATTTENMCWPLTGGVPSQLSEGHGIERMYIAGYQDGSVRIWDATFPVLSLVFVLRSEVEGIEIAGASGAVSAMGFLSTRLSLAVGNEYGLVRLYSLSGSSAETSLHFVSETKCEVHNLRYHEGAQCIAVFSLFNSSVCTLQYGKCGVRLAVGFECGQVAMLDITSLSVLFLTDCISSSISPVISMAVKTYPDAGSKSLKLSENETSQESAKQIVFMLTRDAHIVVMDSTTGSMITSWSMPLKYESAAISMYILEGNSSVSEESGEMHSLIPTRDSQAIGEPAQTNNISESDSLEVEDNANVQAMYLGQIFMASCVLLCCEDALHLYSLKSVIEGDNNSIQEVSLAKPCCWTSIFKKDEKECGVIVVYQTGEIQIRTFPDLEVVGEMSLMSILRWNFKTNMERMMSSSNKGQIALVNGCEFAFISLFAFDNDFRIPEALPCLHDKVLAATAERTFSQDQRKKKGGSPGIFGGIIKGLKGGTADEGVAQAHDTVIAHLEAIFSRFPFSDPPTKFADDQEALELKIDEVEIDEAVPVSSLSHKSKNMQKDKEREREILFEGGTSDTQPRLRTPEEIRAKYRKAGDASTAASQARDKLLERQEKLEKLSRRTEELQSGAENFASMANELAKAMEKRKWWNV